MSTPSLRTVLLTAATSLGSLLLTWTGYTQDLSPTVSRAEHGSVTDINSTDRNLSWMLNKSGQDTTAITSDPRFDRMLLAYFGHLHLPFNRESAPEGLEGYFGPPDSISVKEGRFVTASACAPEFCEEKAMLWADTVSGAHVVIVAVITVAPQEDRSGPATAKLWLVSSRVYGTTPLPQEFQSSLAAWIGNEVMPVLKSDKEIVSDQLDHATLIMAPSGKSAPITLLFDNTKDKSNH